MKAEHENQQSLFSETGDLTALLDNLDHLDDDPRLWPKTLFDLRAVIESQLKHGKATTNEAIARDVTAAIAHYLGGRQVYLPRDSRLQRALRDYQIYANFNGSNHHQLAEKSGLTSAQIYNILAQQKKLHLSRRQHQLPF